MRDPLAEAQKAKEEAEKRLALVTKLREHYPDLGVVTDRWKEERFTSVDVNAIADHVDIRESCGCCSDSVLLARPYIEVEETPVFSLPDCFRVACMEDYEVDRPWDGWEDGMRKEAISEAAIGIVRSHIEASLKERQEAKEEDE